MSKEALVRLQRGRRLVFVATALAVTGWSAPAQPTPGRRTPPPRFTGTLQQPIDSYSGPAFVELLKSARWTDKVRERACLHENNCGKKRLAQMHIQAIDDANLVKVTGAPDAGETGIVIGRLWNSGQYTDSTMLIPGNQKTPDVHYYIVIRSVNSAPTLVDAKVTYEGDGKTADPVIQISYRTGGIAPCKPVLTVAPSETAADFATCDMKGHKDTAVRPSPLRSSEMLVLDAATATPWFSCAEGCCTVQGPPWDFSSDGYGGYFRRREERPRNLHHM